MNDVTSLVAAYGLEPLNMDRISENVFRIHTHHGTFALKKSKYDTQQNREWERIVHWLDHHSFSIAPPITKTRNGQSFVSTNGALYYMTPWVEHTRDNYPSHDIESFYYSVGNLHKQTKNYHSVPDIWHSYRGRREASEQIHERLLARIESFERRHFTSPFGLAVCSQYRDLHYSLEMMKDFSNELPEQSTKEQKIPIVVCHGNLRNSHIIQYYGQSYFINWERMHTGLPHHDLQRFFMHDFRYHDSPVDDYMNKFHIYERIYGFTNEERLQLAINLVDTEHYLKRIERLMANERISELEKVQRLATSHRRVIYSRVAAEALFDTFTSQQLAEEEKEMDET
ncbi:phosphotransferase [Thalassobacillus hwangdonensis]|uniref:Phosphotransferase n=1 Tax=Thalassobacillus hwangdonensis TaxID=546108 RepID=A0ABW3KYH8_9BACI